MKTSEGDSSGTRIDVAIIVVNWNAGAILLDCLRSLKAQTVQACRIVVADNCSSDGSLAAARAAFPDMEYLEFGDNLGFATANNRAIEQVGECRYIALLNPDTVARPDWLERLVAAAENYPDHGMFASLMYITGSHLLDGAGDAYHPSGLAWRRYHRQPKEKMQLVAEEVFGPCAAAALYRRKALEEVGLFDENYFCYFEDVDLAFRMQLRGFRCLFVPDAIIEHVGSAITGKHSDFTVYYSHRNLVWTYAKCMPWPAVLWHLPSHLFMSLIAMIAFAVRGQARTIFRAKWHALLGLRVALKQRKQIHLKSNVTYRIIRPRMSCVPLFAIYFRNILNIFKNKSSY